MSDTDTSHIERLHTHDLEIGATEAVQKHYQRHVVSPKAVSQRKLDYERSRPRWLREMFGEATGVFFYGMSSRFPCFLEPLLTTFSVPWYCRHCQFLPEQDRASFRKFASDWICFRLW